MDFQGTRTLITGGSSGIGLATAKLLAAQGGHVALAARTESRLRDAVASVQAQAAHGVEVTSLTLDVRDAASVMAQVDRLVDEWGSLDLLITSAGTSRAAVVEHTSAELYRKVMDTNYLGTVHVVKAVLPHMQERGRGHIAAVSSVAGFLGVYGYSAYAASKFAVGGFIECLRQESAPHGIGVSILFPGDTDTPMLSEETPLRPLGSTLMAGSVRVESPERVARDLLHGISKRRFRIIPGFDSKVVYFALRFAPRVVRWVMKRKLRSIPASDLAKPIRGAST